MADLNNDGIDDDLQRATMMVLRIATQLGQALARAREDALRRAEQRDRETAEAMRQRHTAERMLAREELHSVERMSATDLEALELPDLTRHFELASQWRTEDHRAADVHAKLTDHIKERFGLDPNEAGELTQAGLLQTAAEFDRRTDIERHAQLAAKSREVQLDHETRADVLALEAEELRATARRLGEKLDPDKDIDQYTDLERARYERVQSAENAAEATERDALSHLSRAEFAELGAKGHEKREAQLRDTPLTPAQQRGVLAAERANAKSPAEAPDASRQAKSSPAKPQVRARVREAELGR